MRFCGRGGEGKGREGKGREEGEEEGDGGGIEAYEMLSSKNAEKSRLARAVHADKEGAGAGREGGRDVKENGLFSVVVVVEHVNQDCWVC